MENQKLKALIEKFKKEGMSELDLEKSGKMMLKSFEVLNSMESLVMTHVKIHGCCKENVNCSELGNQLADLKLPLIREMTIVSPSGYIEKDFLEDWWVRLLQVWSKAVDKKINPPSPQFSELCQVNKYSAENVFYLGCDEPASQANVWINKQAVKLEKFGKMTWLMSKEFSKHIVFQSSWVDLRKNLELPNDFCLIMMSTAAFEKVQKNKLRFKDYFAVVLKCNDEEHQLI